MRTKENKEVVCMPGCLLVEPLVVKPREVRAKSNIIIPTKDRGVVDDHHRMDEIWDVHPFQAKVYAVGVGFENQGMVCKEGDMVLMRRACGPSDAVLIEDKVYAVIRQSDIFTVLRDESK